MWHFIKHFCTVTRHRHKVFVHCLKVGIPMQGLMHDLSKYTPAEFIPGAKYYLGYKSPTEAERADIGYSMAWMHHKGRNKHHFEFWTDYSPKTRKMEAVEMPIKYVKEMFCDRVAASKIYQGKDYTDDKPVSYFKNGNAKNVMHPETAKLLGSWFEMLHNEGEKKTFRYIRKLR